MSRKAGNLLFLSRGMGRGHAAADIAIATEFVSVAPAVNFQFVSYGTGGTLLKERGWNIVDLNLPDDASCWEVQNRVLPHLLSRSAGLFVSHEEFATVPVAKALKWSAVYITDWLLASFTLLTQAVAHADEIIFLDTPEYCDQLNSLQTPITFVDRVFTVCPESISRDTSAIRSDLPADALVVLVAPGGAPASTEAAAPALEMILSAFAKVDLQPKRLVWVASTGDANRLHQAACGRPDMIVLEPHNEFHATLAGADVVITKGNRITVFEAEAMGVPSISLSFGINPIDDRRVASVPTNTFLRAEDVDPDTLAMSIQQAAAKGRTLRIPPGIVRSRAVAAAERLVEHLSP